MNICIHFAKATYTTVHHYIIKKMVSDKNSIRVAMLLVVVAMLLVVVSTLLVSFFGGNGDGVGVIVVGCVSPVTGEYSSNAFKKEKTFTNIFGINLVAHLSKNGVLSIQLEDIHVCCYSHIPLVYSRRWHYSTFHLLVL